MVCVQCTGAHPRPRQTGYAADIPALRQKNPELKTWKQWLEQEYEAQHSA